MFSHTGSLRSARTLPAAVFQVARIDKQGSLLPARGDQTAPPKLSADDLPRRAGGRRTGTRHRARRRPSWRAPSALAHSVFLRDCPWAYAHPEKCVERLAPTWIREALNRHDSLRVQPGMRRSREPDYAML